MLFEDDTPETPFLNYPYVGLPSDFYGPYVEQATGDIVFPDGERFSVNNFGISTNTATGVETPGPGREKMLEFIRDVALLRKRQLSTTSLSA